MDRKYSLIITDTHANSLCSYAALARRISAEVRSHLVSEVVAWLLRVAGVFSYISVEEAPPTTRAKGPRRQCAAQSGAYGEAISVNGKHKPLSVFTLLCIYFIQSDMLGLSKFLLFDLVLCRLTVQHALCGANDFVVWEM